MFESRRNRALCGIYTANCLKLIKHSWKQMTWRIRTDFWIDLRHKIPLLHTLVCSERRAWFARNQSKWMCQAKIYRESMIKTWALYTYQASQYFFFLINLILRKRKWMALDTQGANNIIILLFWRWTITSTAVKQYLIDFNLSHGNTDTQYTFIACFFLRIVKCLTSHMNKLTWAQPNYKHQLLLLASFQ